MRKQAVATLGGLWCIAAWGQDLIDCIDPDVLAGLVFRSQNQSDTVIGAAIPDKMASINAPTAFEWIGGSSRTVGIINGVPTKMVTGAFRTFAAPEEALDLALSGLAEDGWEIVSESNGMVSVFVTQIMRAPQKTACLDNDPVNVTANAVNDVTYVTYNFSSSAQNMTCAAGGRPSFGTSFAVDEYLPSLEFPPDPGTGDPVYPSGSGSGGNMGERNFRTELRHGQSIGNLTRYLSRQLAEQGWQADASWIGQTTAGSSWSKQPEADMNLRATLQVLEVDDSFFNVNFRITTVQ